MLFVVCSLQFLSKVLLMTNNYSLKKLEVELLFRSQG